MKLKPVLFAFFFLSCLVSQSFARDTTTARPAAQSSTPKKVFVIPVEGDVDPNMAEFIARGLHEAEAYPDALIILEMDTFGGRVDAAFQIVDTILNAPRGKTIAYVKTKAISAGSLIALACSKLVMKHNTTIGDCAPIAVTSEGPQMLGEKFQSPLRAKFRTLAKRNGFPQILAEALVTPEMVVYKVTTCDSTFYIDSIGFVSLSDAIKKTVTAKTVVVKKGQLLTMDDIEAKQLGFSKMSVESVEELLTALQIPRYDIIRIKKNWSESFVHLIGLIAPVLMIIGFAGLYIEYKTPGLIAPGIIGGLCLALVFFGQYMVGLANYTDLLIIIIGIVLMGIEIFVLPGFGIAGIAGIACVVIGLILSFQSFVIPSPSMPWQARELTANIGRVLGSFVAAFIGGILFIRFVIPSFSKVMPGPYLDATLKSSHADSEAIVGVKEGDEGEVITALRPSGRVAFGPQTLDVVTEGGFVEKGSRVVIIKISRSKITVSRK